MARKRKVATTEGDLNIMGSNYTVELVDDMCAVNPNSDKPHYGCACIPERKIRLFNNGHPEDAFRTLLEEMGHCIADELAINCFDTKQGHEDLRRIMAALGDTLLRNGFVTLGRG